jgi:CDP-diacylglycerol--glycerol-3-phosphate 3-phosphatidyltransferase
VTTQLPAKPVPHWNLANAFTLLRVALVPLFAWLLVWRDPSLPKVAAAVFAVAAATDGLDGFVARRLHLVSGFGQTLDPIADKLLVGTALIALALDHRMPWWALIIILGREFLVSGLRIWLARRGRALPSSMLGKIKTNFQILAVLLLTLLAPENPAALVVLWISIVLTVLSGLQYFAAAFRGRAGVPWR